MAYANTRRFPIRGAVSERCVVMAEFDYCSRCVLCRFGERPDMKAMVEVVRLVAGERLYAAGDRPAYVYCVRRGVIGDYRVDTDDAIPSGLGGDALVDVAFAGEAVGLKGIGTPHYGSDAIAETDAELCAVPLDVVRQRVSVAPPLNDCMIRAFSAQLGRMRSLAAVRAQHYGEAGLARLLVLIAGRLSKGVTTGVICLTLPRRLLADYLGVSLSTAARQLDALVRRRLIHVRRSRICLLDIGELMRLAGSVLP